jgi:hypothetical protein
MPTFRSLFPRPVFPWEQRGDVPGKNRAVQADPFTPFAFLFVTEDRDRVDSRCSSSRKIAGGQRCNQ